MHCLLTNTAGSLGLVAGGIGLVAGVYGLVRTQLWIRRMRASEQEHNAFLKRMLDEDRARWADRWGDGPETIP